MFSRKPQGWSFVAVIACALLTPQPGEGGPETTWVTTAVGSVTVPGAATTSPSGRMTVSGEGTDIWGGADGFQYLYQRLSGNMQITAKITGLQNTDGWAKAGLMIRQGLTAGSVHASLFATPSNGIVFQQRSAAGGLTTRSGIPGAAPVWLRLARIGAEVTASVSSDGTTWAKIGTVSVLMSTDVMIGVAVTSRMPSRLTTATFDKVAVAKLAATPATPPAGPVAAWSFDDGAGGLLQDSVGGLDGVITGATWTSAGRHAGALLFNGVDQMVTVPADAALNLTTGMTLEAWVNPTSVASWRNVAMKEGSNDLAYALYASDASSKPQAAVNMGAGQLVASGTAPLPANTWSHLATTFDGSTHRLFVNGVQVGSVAAAGTLWQTTAPFRIGGNSLWGGWFDGAIDDMRVYNRALSPTEIQTDMNTPVASPPPDTTPPNVAISSPVNGATVSGTVGVVASASDNVGVASVQFLLNGVNLGGAVTAAPYTVTWSTQAVPNGTYKLTAVARDHSGNANVSADVVITVSNASPFVIGKTVTFTSADHFATLPDGRATIDGYTLEVWLAGANTASAQPYKTSSLGKPASTTTTINVDQQAFFASLPKGQEFFATTTATGPGGSARSAASNSFMMQ
jgi:regulation of enolase protein 1 (concanavalin A-like superfamily)